MKITTLERNMKRSKLVVLSGMMAVYVFSSQVFSAPMSCPTNFDLRSDKLCNCTSNKLIHCKPKGELLYTHTNGVNIYGKKLHTKDGTVVKCDGKTWGVRMVDKSLGFRCIK
jgi:hypothetical protein